MKLTATCQQAAMFLALFVLLFTSGALLNKSYAQTPYGSCSMTAEYYQKRYLAGQNASDLVCFQTALQRELEGTANPAPSTTKTPTKQSPNSDRIETWCSSMQSDIPFEDCVKKQTVADIKIQNFLSKDKGDYSNHNAVSSCSFYVRGGAGGGSMGLDDYEPIASCIDLQAKKAASMFQGCVKMVTGQTITGDTLPSFPNGKSLRGYERIKMCFLSQLP